MNPPGPRGLPLIGSLLDFIRVKEAPNFLLRTAREYGDIAFLRMGRTPLYLVNRPEWIREILVVKNRNFGKSRGLERAKAFLGEGLLTSEGDYHLRQRRMQQPMFARERLAGYATVMAEHAQRRSQAWRDGAHVDLFHEMMTLTMGIAGKTLLDAEVEGEVEEIAHAIEELFRLLPFALMPGSEYLEKIPIPPTLRFRRNKATLDRIMYRLIEERRREGRYRGDLLSLLLAARDTEGDGKGMDDRQIRDEVMTLFIAGHETTAVALTWTLALLGKHPEAAKRVAEEFAREANGALPGLAQADRMEFTRRAFAESMRIYPPAFAIGRKALGAFSLGSYEIPAGAIVLMSPYAVQRDPRWFPDPERFDPDRWLPERVKERPEFCYFPFGGGPRLCIGESFAWLECVLLTGLLCANWRFEPDPVHPFLLDPLFTLRPRGGMPGTLHRR